jgi:hypothetical protein
MMSELAMVFEVSSPTFQHAICHHSFMYHTNNWDMTFMERLLVGRITDRLPCSVLGDGFGFLAIRAAQKWPMHGKKLATLRSLGF